MNDENMNNNEENTNIKSTIKVNKNLIIYSLWFIPIIIIFCSVFNYLMYLKGSETINKMTQNVINDFEKSKTVDKNEYNGNTIGDYERDFSQTGDKEFCVILIETNVNGESIGFFEKTYKFKNNVTWGDYLENATSKPDSFMEIEKYNCVKKGQNKSYSELKGVFDACFEEFGPDKRISLEEKILDKSIGCYMYDSK